MLTRMVDGIEAVLSDEEEAAVRAEWAAWEVERAAARQANAAEAGQLVTQADLREFIAAVGTALPAVRAVKAYAKAVQQP